MPVTIEREPLSASRFDRENCCFCFRQTPFWNPQNDVAVCEECAPLHSQEQVPTKEAWCNAVATRFPRPFWYPSRI